MPLIGESIFFIHIPKTGGAAIEADLGGLIPKRGNFIVNQAGRLAMRGAFSLTRKQRAVLYGRICVGLAPQHLTLNEVVALGLVPAHELLEKYTCFTVVRNPFSRVVSQWRSHGRFKKYPDINRFIRDWLFNFSLKKTQADISHSRPQSDFLKLDAFFRGDRSEPTIDVLRFERLNEDYKRFLKDCGREVHDLPTRNKSPGRSQDYQSMLDANSRSLVEQYYYEDLHCFDYQW